MALMDVTVIEQNLIETLREAIASTDKSASRSGTLQGRAMVLHVYKEKNTTKRRWHARLLIKTGTDF